MLWAYNSKQCASYAERPTSGTDIASLLGIQFRDWINEYSELFKCAADR